MTDAAERDPFGSDIVTEPREIEAAVGSLNARALAELVQRFHAFALHPLPRLEAPSGEVLVVSPEPGYGKSHLLGRLFQRLDDDATLLYLRPFQDAASAWISILEKVVTELDHSDDPCKLTVDPGEPTQLDTLARRVLLALVGELLATGELAHPQREAALTMMRKRPATALELPEWRDWLASDRAQILSALDGSLKRRGVELYPSRRAWLEVLLSYAYSEEDTELRQLCLDWLNYRPLDPEEGKRLGLRRAELPEEELPYQQRNERAFQRLRDLFAIGAFYRPFLLCFDQTELYGADPALARSFGVVLSRLRRETVNHLAVVTANLNVWQQRVERHFEEADRHAISPELVELEGMTEAEARALVRQRFDAWEIELDPELFCDQHLRELFARRPRHGVREVLRAAQRAWNAEAAPDARAIFESYRRKLLAAPKGLAYDANVLQWSVEQILGPAVGAEVSRIQSPKGYLTVRWRGPEGRTELFGFEAGAHWKRWQAILREARLYFEDAAERQPRSTFFRVPAQQTLPARVTEDFRKVTPAAKRVDLTLDEAASLFAAHDVMADVAQGNFALAEAETLSALRAALEPLARRVWGRDDTVPPPPPDGPKPELLERFVEEKKFVTLALTLAAFPGCVEAAVLAVAKRLQKVKIHTSPSNTVLQWSP